MTSIRPDRTLGPGHDEFWAWCNKGELRLQRCGTCHKLSWPVVPACEHCEGSDLIWERMSGKGRLASWCTFERDYYAGTLPIPWDVILVELVEGPLFLSNPFGFSWRECEADLPVSVQFIECEDQGGTFSLPVFARA